MDRKDLLALSIGSDDLDFALDDHEEVVGRVAGAEEHVTDFDGALAPELRKRGELRRIEHERRVADEGVGHLVT